MWDYSFEVPTLMILGIILLFYFSRPRLPIKRNRVFLQMIMIETLTIVIDVCASHADTHYRAWAIYYVNFINFLYFIAFFVRAYILYKFAISVLKIDIENKRCVRFFIRIPMYIGFIMALHSMIVGSAENSHFIYYVDEAGYHAGGIYHILYVIAFFYAMMSFICSFQFRNSLGRRREKYAMFLYNLIVFTSLIVRLVLPQYLVMDTFIIMAILVVYLGFINPEYFLDLRAITFNSVALYEHLEENLNEFKQAPMGVTINNYHEMRDIYGMANLEEGFALIGKYLKQVFPKGIVFYLRNGRYIVLVDPSTDYDAKCKEIAERFKKVWESERVELYLSASFVTFEILKGKYPTDILIGTMVKALDKAGQAESDEPVYVTESDVEKVGKEKYIRASIENAIDGNGFELYLQPIVDAVSGKIIGAEALSRIKDLEGKIISPGLFIPVAESSGRINALGEIVFDRTCKFIAEKGLESMGIEWINVNLSPSQFIRTDLAERYADIADKYGIDPAKVHLEITEGSMIDDNFLLKQIGAMEEKGFKFVLDDYGTGYSNLARLKKCPFINVKLDMSIVWDFCKEPDAILPNMIQAFKHMGFRITAEGIEDEGMVSTMTGIGCDLLQGYHYSKPISAEEFAEKYSA